MPTAISSATTNETDYFSVLRIATDIERNMWEVRVRKRAARVTIRSTPVHHQSCRATFVTNHLRTDIFFQLWIRFSYTEEMKG